MGLVLRGSEWEAVPNVWDGFDMARIGRIRLDLASQAMCDLPNKMEVSGSQRVYEETQD